MTKPKQAWRCQKCGCHGVSIPRATPRSKFCAWCARDLAFLGLRWCSACRQGRPAADWASEKKGYCRPCQKAKNAEWRAEHLEEARQYSRDYHAEHHEAAIARKRAYYQANRTELLEDKHAYYQANRETIKARVRAYRPHRPAASIERERRRQRVKTPIYRANERAAALRRKAALWRSLIGMTGAT